ncbi:MAG: aminomethyl-transferring glycine dehydrogenase subunit GcvPB [Candidatus Hadarchaeota archaeon]
MCDKGDKGGESLNYRQAKWEEPLIFEKGNKEGDVAIEEKKSSEHNIPPNLRRKELNLPELSEPEIVKHFTRLSQMNYGVDSGLYPLGSCTMKYNPKTLEEISSTTGVESMHPEQPEETVQGNLELLYRLKELFREITGMDHFTLQPSAGAQGEFTAMNIVREYHKSKKNEKSEIIVPDSSHGTNPISAKMAGFEIIELPSNKKGRIDIKALKSIISERTAGIMLTNPNTLGLFEKNIEEIVGLVHGHGGLLFYDGANLNSIMGKTRPGDMGFDLLHLNLHKTFAAPHGGGGPGSGPVGVKNELEEFLPKPRIKYDRKNDFYKLDKEREKRNSKVHPYIGNFKVLLKAYAYIRLMGPRGLKKASEIAVLNANYLQRKARNIEGINSKYGLDVPCKHETVLSCKELKSRTGVSAMDVGKRLLDFGFHSPTLYFPDIVKEAMMIEPTETASKSEIDEYLTALEKIADESFSDPSKVKNAPHNTSIGRLDYTNAARNPVLSWRMFKEK